VRVVVCVVGLAGQQDSLDEVGYAGEAGGAAVPEGAGLPPVAEIAKGGFAGEGGGAGAEVGAGRLGG
jgi:hypothetical protein